MALMLFISSGWKKFWIRLDLYHLLQRVKETVGKTTGGKKDPVKAAALGVAMSSAFTSEKRGLFPPPETIEARMEQAKQDFLPQGTWTEATTQAWNTQRKHVRSCLTLPPEFKHVPIVIYDRHGDEFLVRSDANNENLHRHLPNILPKSGGITLIDAILAVYSLDRTMKKIVKFNRIWPDIT